MTTPPPKAIPLTKLFDPPAEVDDEVNVETTPQASITTPQDQQETLTLTAQAWAEDMIAIITGSADGPRGGEPLPDSPPFNLGDSGVVGALPPIGLGEPEAVEQPKKGSGGKGEDEGGNGKEGGEKDGDAPKQPGEKDGDKDSKGGNGTENDDDPKQPDEDGKGGDEDKGAVDKPKKAKEQPDDGKQPDYGKGKQPEAPPLVDDSQDDDDSQSDDEEDDETYDGGALKVQAKDNRPSLPRYVIYCDLSPKNAIAGLPDPTRIGGFNVFILAFWMTQPRNSKGQRVITGKASDQLANYCKAPAADRRARKAQFKAAGVKLMMSVFGEADAPQTNGRKPINLAREIAAFVKKYDFDGVDVDYEEFDTFEDRKASDWLIKLLKTLRKELPSPQYLLTAAPIAPWFSTKRYGTASWTDIHRQIPLDWYNVQYYNQGADKYNTLSTLLWDSGDFFPQSSIFELIVHSKIPANSLVIGKPALRKDANDGYMNESLLAQCMADALKQGWSAGLMFWQYRSETSPSLLPGILKKVKEIQQE